MVSSCGLLLTKMMLDVLTSKGLPNKKTVDCKVLYVTPKALESLLPEHEEASPAVPEPKHLINTRNVRNKRKNEYTRFSTDTCNRRLRGYHDFGSLVMFVPAFSGGSFRLLLDQHSLQVCF